MRLHGLSWRIGLPFLLLVLFATLTLALYMRQQIAWQTTERLERLADADADFIVRASLPTTEKMASDLSRVTGFQACFRRGRMLTPDVDNDELRAGLLAKAADGRAHAVAGHEVVMVPIDEQTTFVLMHRSGQELLDPRILQVVGSFWLLALLLAWLVVRGLVRPLRNLATQVTRIEQPQSLALPEADRADELGDLARSLARTHRALHEERDQRARMEKLAVLGRMTASLAHEIRNPIAAIKMHAQLALDDSAGEAYTVIEREATRIEGMLNQWMFLTRPEPPALNACDVAELAARTVADHASQCEHAGVRVTVHRHGETVTRCDRKRLEHVLQNLLVNAVQAMPRGGDLEVTVSGNASTVEIVLQDSGPGFSPDALRRATEFFFSEKEGGMGIGLSVASAIVGAHEGTLQVENRPRGACVRITLPRPPQDPS